MHHRVLLLACAILELAASDARADRLQGTRFDLVESSHVVDVSIDRGSARLVVTRTVENPGPKSDQAVFWLDLPDGAVATRLRTAAVNAKGETVWFEGELLEAELAAARYKELTGIGGYYPKDPALLSWRHQGQLALQVFPIPAQSKKTIEYTLEMPLTYAGGRYTAKLPALGSEDRPASVRCVPVHSMDSVRVNGVTIATGQAIAASRELEIELVPRPAARVEGALASEPFASNKVLVHAHIAAAPRLGEVPASAAIAIVIDTSASMREDLPLAIRAARAYLSHFSSAEVHIVAFDRTPKAPFGGALTPKDAVAKLYSWQPALGNGSRVDQALLRADHILAQSSAKERRILVLSDLRTRRALDGDAMSRQTLASAAIVHIAWLVPGGPALEREDEDAWAKLPRKTGGLLWRATVPDIVDATTARVFEEWVRPKRIDHLVVQGMPVSFPVPDVLEEGAGLDHFGIEDKPITQVTITGELWSRAVKVELGPSASEGKLWSALVFGSPPLLSQLSDMESMALAMNGHAVSPVTSYLAIEPGVRPSFEGLEEAVWLSGVGEGGGGQGIGLGTIGTIGYGGTAFDHPAVLQRALEAAMKKCGATTGAASVSIETTKDEIVEIGAVELSPARSNTTENCVAEELWSFHLPAAFVQLHADWIVSARL